MFSRPLINEERLRDLDLLSRERETEVVKCTNICCKDKKEQSSPHLFAESNGLKFWEGKLSTR